MKLWLGAGLALLLLAFAPAWADTASDLAQCKKTVQAKIEYPVGDDVADCMVAAGYILDHDRHVDELTSCGTTDFAGSVLRCYGKADQVEKRPLPRALVPNWRTAPMNTLLEVEADWNTKCRGGQATWFLTEDACNTRARAVAILEARGWCWAPAPGSKDDSEASKTWQDCRPVKR